MIVTEQEIIELKKFILQLNEMKDAVVIVEGKRDSQALMRLGFSFNNYYCIFHFV